MQITVTDNSLTIDKIWNIRKNKVGGFVLCCTVVSARATITDVVD